MKTHCEIKEVVWLEKSIQEVLLPHCDTPKRFSIWVSTIPYNASDPGKFPFSIVHNGVTLARGVVVGGTTQERVQAVNVLGDLCSMRYGMERSG